MEYPQGGVLCDVCTHGSKVAADALKLAKKHAKAFDAKVFIVTSMVGGPEVLREDFEKAEKDLEFAKSGFKKEEIPCEARLSVRGLEPGEDLVQFAEENNIDQIRLTLLLKEILTSKIVML